MFHWSDLSLVVAQWWITCLIFLRFRVRVQLTPERDSNKNVSIKVKYYSPIIWTYWNKMPLEHMTLEKMTSEQMALEQMALEQIAL